VRWREPPLSVECRWEGRQVTVAVRGEVDFATADVLAGHLDDAVRSEPERLTLDLARTTFLDAAGLRLIARARRALAPTCPITLRSPTRQVRIALEASGLAGLCPIDDPAQPGQPPREDPARDKRPFTD
jgi:anti-anti-sigma factor